MSGCSLYISRISHIGAKLFGALGLALTLAASPAFAQSGPEQRGMKAAETQSQALPENPPGTPDRATVAKTAKDLGLPEAALQDGVVGLGHIYARRYSKAQAIFDRLSADYPKLTIGPFGNVLLYQAWMLENFDFVKDKEYREASKMGLERAEEAIKAEESVAWNEFVWGVLNGLVSIYDIRQGEYMSALLPALRSVPAMERAIELEPSFHDPTLGLGVYHFWRTVLSEAYWFLPSIGDKKALGMSQMKQVVNTATFAGPGAHLALAYSHLQLRDVASAKKSCEALEALYPNNIINNMLLGRIALRQRKYEVARGYFDKIKAVDPGNWLVEYYQGLMEMRQRNYEPARDHFLAYLSHDGDVSGQAWGHYRLGDTYWFLHEDDKAEAEWKKSLKKNNAMKGPKMRLEGKLPKRPPKGQTQGGKAGPKGGSRVDGKPVKAVKPNHVRVRQDAPDYRPPELSEPTPDDED